MLTGQNGILNRAGQAKVESEKASLIEEIKLAIQEKIVENLGTINEDEFYGILEKYGEISNNDTKLITTNGNYELMVSDLYKGEIKSSLVTTPIESWEYNISGSNITLSKYIGTDTKIIIPEKFIVNNVSYNTVLKTADPSTQSGPFIGNTIITAIKFEDNVYGSGYCMFNNCYNLKKVYSLPSLSNNLRYMFANCYALESIPTFPEGTKYLDWAFSSCESLNYKHDIPSTVETMIGTFSGCISLNGTINILSENITDFSNCFNSRNMKIVLNVPKNTTSYTTISTVINNWNNVYLYGNEKLSVLCWGDSLTAGAGGNGTTYVSILKSLCPEKINAINMGVGGEKTITIAGRQGGIPMVVDEFTIPDNTNSVEIKISSKNGEEVLPAIQSTTGINPCYINDIKGNISYNNGKYYFTRIRTGKATYVSKDTEIQTEAMKDYANPDILVLWTGTNDNPDEDDIQNVIDKQKQMIKYANTDRYIVLGLTIPNKEKVNEILSKEYGNHFLDIRSYLIENGLNDAKITATEQDTTDLSQNKVPTSLRSDSTHFNSFGYSIIGQQVYNKLVSLGYIEN